jgi:putative hydrolase of the HAD superfamily
VRRHITLLFDLGGVVYDAATFDVLASLLNTDLSEDDLIARYLRSTAVRAFELGKISPDDFAGRFVEEWGLSLTPDEFLDEFTAFVRRPYDGAEELLARLRGTHRVCCLSNSNEVHWTRFGPFLDCFDVAFSSHLLGEIKPDAGVFRRVMSELDAAPDSLYFFDDSAPNVEAARELGMNAFWVKGIEATVRCLEAEGLLSDGRS